MAARFGGIAGRFSGSICAGLLLLLGQAAYAVDPAKLTLVDQYGAPGGLETDRPGLQVAIVVSATRLRRLKAWEQAIRRIDDSVPLVRVADVPRTAPTEYESVAEKLKKRLPPDVNVLIDLEGVWAEAYELDVTVPNVLIFDGMGELVGVHSGMFRKSLEEALKADLQGTGSD
jgi:hypothetical protein